VLKERSSVVKIQILILATGRMGPLLLNTKSRALILAGLSFASMGCSTLSSSERPVTFRPVVESKLPDRTPESDAQAQEFLDEASPKIKRQNLPSKRPHGCLIGAAGGFGLGATVGGIVGLGVFTSNGGFDSARSTPQGFLVLLGGSVILVPIGGLAGGTLGLLGGCLVELAH